MTVLSGMNLPKGVASGGIELLMQIKTGESGSRRKGMQKGSRITLQMMMHHLLPSSMF
jgi:hypothetical protein